MKYKTYNEEKQELLDCFLEKTFYKDWSLENKNMEENLFQSLELQITSGCNLDCSYCYYKKKEDLNSLKKFKPKNILNNIDILINWLDSKKLFPFTIEIFSGEPLIHNVTFDVIYKITDYYNKNNQPINIVIPTNMTWINNNILYDKVVKLIKDIEGKFKGNNIGISCSIDGKYMDKENRPYIKHSKNDEIYNDEFYDKVFKFAKEYNCGFHPMIHYNNIDNWIKNFNWFQEMFIKYNLNRHNIYLLEIRNKGWNKYTANKFKELLKYIYNYQLHTLLNHDIDYFCNNYVIGNITKDGKKYKIQNMNLFSSLITHGRGIGCSMQTTMFCKLNDLTFNSCHRMSYDHLNGFKLENNKMVPLNFDFYIATMSYNVESAPYCEKCILKYLCSGGCLGSNFESSGDFFTVHPSICLVEYAKILALIEFLVENNIWDKVMNNISKSEKVIAFEKIKQWRYE